MTALQRYELAQMQSLPLHLKIIKTVARISEWYSEYDGLVYCAFSGGLDSTVLADIITKTKLDIPLVFCDTHLEYPEIRAFALSKNPIVIQPTHHFRWVVENYGFPVISKEVSKNISRARNTNDPIQRSLRLFGGINPTSGKKQNRGVPTKYHYIVNAPFKISDVCCDVIKKSPFKKYNKSSKRVPITAELADESYKRGLSYLQHGCNNYNATIPKSTPIGFWTRQDVLAYLLAFNVKYCDEIYGKIIYNPETRLLETTGEQRTGCMFCMFGVHLEKHPNRFERMKITHPKHYAVCMNLGCGNVMDYIGVKH